MNRNIPLSTIVPKNEIILFREFIYHLGRKPAKLLLRNAILLRFEEFCKAHEQIQDAGQVSGLQAFFSKTQEMLLNKNYAILLYRSKIAHYKFYGIHDGDDLVEELSAEEFLDYREKYACNTHTPPEKKLLIDFQPFYSFGPVIRDHKKIGSGQRFLNSYMAGKLHSETDRWDAYLCEFLKIHSINNEQILVDGDIIKNSDQLFDALHQAIPHLEALPPNAPIQSASPFLKGLGFKEGFGATASRVLDTMQLLANLIEEPNAEYFEEFISRIPMVSKVAVISPHGWFGQENVLGRPDTGGQIVYILDQVRAMEKHLLASLKAAGVAVIPKIIVLTRLIPENEGTTSDQRLEKIHDSMNCWILRVPFKDRDMKIIPQWISRFNIWPYLEQFALDGKLELTTELGGKPDMIIGNYSDGNLVASLLSSWMGVIQCNIAHALEKSKYLFADLYWQDMEEEYHFSAQFTADLISMHKADIIIASTSQEIAGTDTAIGQYESYYLFSMPNLCKVVNGINLFHPKFNVVSPGVEETIYFPYWQEEKRLNNRVKELTHRLMEAENNMSYGFLENPDRPPIFTMARLDKIKNIGGLVESYGQNKELQELANLIIIAGTVNEEETSGQEESGELKKIYRLIDTYQLNGKVRWLCKQTCRSDNGEIYRIIADRKGIFVQPALFEAFGLTVLEAMSSGLPVFATQFGGPLEIIKDGKSGFLINPTAPNLLTQPILEFFIKSSTQPGYWESIAKNAFERVQECYTWKLYSEKLFKFANLYGFWNYSALAVEKQEIGQYCDLLFHLLYKKRADACLHD